MNTNVVYNFIKEIALCLRVILRISKPYTITRFFIRVIAGLLPLVRVYLLKLILDYLAQIQPNENYNMFIIYVILGFIIEFALTSCDKIDVYVAGIQDEMVNNSLDEKIIEKSSNVDIRFFDSPECYNKLQMVKENSQAINQVIWDLVSFVSSFIAFVTSLIIMWNYSPIFSLLITLAYLPILICDRLYIKKMYDFQIRNIDKERKKIYVTNTVSTKAHSKTIRIFGLSKYFLEIFTSIWKSLIIEKKNLAKRWTLVTLVISIIPHIFTIFVLYQVGINILEGRNSIGDFSLYFGIITQVVTNLFIIVNSIVRITENQIRIHDFKDFLDWENSIEGTGIIELDNIDSIEFQNVSFTYPGNDYPTLKQINFKFKAKDKIAFIGINGSGKSTIIKLLLRFYDPTHGQILINDIDIKQYTPESIRKQYSVMFQDYMNYAFTLRDNVKISDLDRMISDEEIIEACKKSGVSDFANNWEKGLDTFLYKEFDENGEELSGGQNQKVSLARIFARRRRIFLLDEPSSSLDPESEFILFEKIFSLCKDKGLIIITHRLINIPKVDKILVFENGRIIEEGSHRELLKKDGRYAVIFKHEANKYVIP